MSVRTMFSHTKEILKLTVPMLSVMVIVALTTAGVINFKSESIPELQESIQSSSTVVEKEATPPISEVESQLQKAASTTSTMQEDNNSEATVGGTVEIENTPTAQPSATSTPTTQPSPTTSTTPTSSVTPTVSAGHIQFVVIEKVDNKDVTIENAKVIVKNAKTDATLFDGITDEEGTTPQWQIASDTQIEVYAYPPSDLEDYCGTMVTMTTSSSNSKPISLTIVSSDTTEFCIQEN